MTGPPQGTIFAAQLIKEIFVKKYVPVLLSLTALVVAGCSSQNSEAESDSNSAEAETSAPVSDTELCHETEYYEANIEFCASAVGDIGVVPEGSVTTEDGSFIEYPDGYHAVISSVTAGPADETLIDDERPELDGMITVTMTITNKGEAPIQLNNDGFGTSQVNLYYGENRYEAQGWMTTGGVGDLPQQLVPGTSAEFANDFTLPSAEMDGPLAVEFSPDANVYTKYLFTDVETLIN
jgi:hypothetical protein